MNKGPYSLPGETFPHDSTIVADIGFQLDRDDSMVSGDGGGGAERCGVCRTTFDIYYILHLFLHSL